LLARTKVGLGVPGIPGAKRGVVGVVRLQKTRRGLSRGLDPLTGGTGGDVGADRASDARPPEVRSDGVEGLPGSLGVRRSGHHGTREGSGSEGQERWRCRLGLEVPEVVTVAEVARAAGDGGVVQRIIGVGTLGVVQEGSLTLMS